MEPHWRPAQVYPCVGVPAFVFPPSDSDGSCVKHSCHSCGYQSLGEEIAANLQLLQDQVKTETYVDVFACSQLIVIAQSWVYI
jgi:hypothetical protein